MSNEIQNHESNQSIMISSERYAFGMQMAKDLASSTMVPREYQGNVGNSVIAVDIAMRLRVSPLMVMQNLHIIHGKPAWAAQFLIASLNACGKFTSLQYEFTGEPLTDSWSCRCFATEKSTNTVIYGPVVTYRMAKEEGWVSKSGSKWKTMPELMMHYRAAAFFVRTNSPEIAIGIMTKDEVEDIGPQPKFINKNNITVLQPKPAVAVLENQAEIIVSEEEMEVNFQLVKETIAECNDEHELSDIYRKYSKQFPYLHEKIVEECKFKKAALREALNEFKEAMN